MTIIVNKRAVLKMDAIIRKLDIMTMVQSVTALRAKSW